MWIWICALVLAGCISEPKNWVMLNHPDDIQNRDPLQNRVIDILDRYDAEIRYPTISVTYPYHGAVFPPEIAAPRISWKDSKTESQNWLLTIRFSETSNILYALTDKESWEPDRRAWERIKKHSKSSRAELTVLGLAKGDTLKIVSKGTVGFSTSTDPVSASIFYRHVPLPFSTKNFKKMKWCLADIASYQKPKVVMDKIGVCASCHIFSSDGKYFSMEMNYGYDGGAQFIKPVEKEIVLTGEDFFSWNSFPRSGIIPKTRGLFGKMSPSGRYVAASVNEISLALITRDADFSQVFFPTYGILAYYSVEKQEIKPLPGADDYNYVQANPNWRHDEKYIVFARAKTKNEVHDDIRDVSSKYKNEDIYTLNKKYNIQFDLYTITFNGGKGGTPKPLKGASRNGMSNYFARYSPDGRWIVFTRSKSGIMLQPDSELYIIPSEGGTARRMTCNRKLFNSWHSWSPNSRWLLFSSKVNSPYTEVFLTHIDENGNDSPPVLLRRLSRPGFAVNVPEFANIPADAIDAIRVK
jgi:hypothetical protein